MSKLSIAVKGGYVYLYVKKKRIMYRVSDVLQGYTAVKKFDKENGVIALLEI